MKKKFLGMILALVVMMIIPLAIVGAETPVLSVSGSIDATTGEVTRVADGETLNITVAVDGKATLSVKNHNNAKPVFNKGGDTAIGYSVKDDYSIEIVGDRKTTTPTTITVTVGQKTLYCHVTVVEKKIIEFNVNGTIKTLKDGDDHTYNQLMANNIEVYVGDVFTITGGTARFNSGEELLGIAKESFSSTDASFDESTRSVAFTSGQKNISFTLNVDDPTATRSEKHERTQTYRIHVIAREVDVTVEKNPEHKDFVSVYDAGTAFDFNSIRLAVYYKNTTKLQDYAYFNGAQGFKADRVIMAVGQDEFTVRYNNENYTFTFSELGISTVAAKTVTASIVKDGKTTYYYGEVFDFTELILSVTEQGLSGEKKYNVDHTGFTIVSPEGQMNAETKDIVIKYDTKEYKFNLKNDLGVDLFEDNRVLSSLKVSGTPTKYEYADGMIVTDWSGLTFTAVYTIKNETGTKTVEKTLSRDEIANNLKAKPCEYSKYYPERNTYITVEYTEGQRAVSAQVKGFKIVPKAVVSIEVTKGPTKANYETGDALNLTGMEITITYNDDSTAVKPYNFSSFTCNPAHGDKVSADTDAITVTYKDDDIATADTWEGIKVETKIKIKRVTVSVKPDKMEYEVGEKFDPSGMELTIIYADADTPDKIISYGQSGFPTGLNNATLDKKGDNISITFTVKNPINSADSYDVTLSGIKVKEKVIPASMDNVSYTKSFLAGVKFDVEKDIDDYTVTMSDGSKLTKDDMDELIEDKAATLTVSPATTLKETNKTVTLSLTYKGKTITKSLSVEVKTPACVLSTSGGNTVLLTPYEKLELALEAANDLTTTQAKKVTITLSSDVVLTTGYTFNAERSIIIDLNSYDLTLAENQLFVPHKSSYSTVEIVLINSAKNDSTIKYDATNKDKWIILGKNEQIIIDNETEIPGIYEITLKTDGNGKITGPIEVAHGNDAKYIITPNTGYEIDTVTLDKKAQGKGETVTLEAVDSDHTIEVTFKKTVVEWVSPFTDVRKGASYYDAVGFVYENGLFKGVSNTEFEPNETMTRAMFVTVLGRLAGISENDSRYTGKSTFKDVVSSTATDWYVPYVAWASQNGLLLGYEDGTFRPNNEISNTEMYILMERYARNFLGITASTSSVSITVSDSAQIPTWSGAREAVQFATKYKFLVKTGNRINPNADAKRYELATLLKSFCDSFGLLGTVDEK